MNREEDFILDPDTGVDELLETGLRPTSLDEFVGQAPVRERRSIHIQAARARGESLDHVLLYGPPGLG